MYKNKISAVYQIINTGTGEKYVGSSKNVKKRWYNHKCQSFWKQYPNSPLYQDMQKYGVDKFRFQILCPVEPEHLKEVEQELIEMLHPTYNDKRAKGWNVERRKESNRKWHQSENGKKYNHKQSQNMKKYNNQLCSYNGEIVILATLATRFRKAGLEHPTKEAKKFLLPNNN